MWREVVGAALPRPRHAHEADLDAALAIEATRPTEMMTLAEIALPYAELGEAETDALASASTRTGAAAAGFGDLARRSTAAASDRAPGRRDAADARGAAPRPPSAARCSCSARRQPPGRCRSPAGWRHHSWSRSPSARPDRQGDEGRHARRCDEALRQQLFAERITSFGQELGTDYLQELARARRPDRRHDDPAGAR